MARFLAVLLVLLLVGAPLSASVFEPRPGTKIVRDGDVFGRAFLSCPTTYNANDPDVRLMKAYLASKGIDGVEAINTVKNFIDQCRASMAVTCETTAIVEVPETLGGGSLATAPAGQTQDKDVLVTSCHVLELFRNHPSQTSCYVKPAQLGFVGARRKIRIPDAFSTSEEWCDVGADLAVVEVEKPNPRSTLLSDMIPTIEYTVFDEDQVADAMNAGAEFVSISFVTLNEVLNPLVSFNGTTAYETGRMT